MAEDGQSTPNTVIPVSTSKDYKAVVTPSIFGSLTWSTPSTKITLSEANPSVTVNALASASSAVGVETLNLHFTIGGALDCQDSLPITVAKVDITRTPGGIITDTTSDVMVGTHIILAGVVSPPGLTVTSKEWDIPGETVKSYSQSQQTGSALPLTPSDKLTDSLSYYWIDGSFAGDSQEVEYSVIVEGNLFDATTTFVVFRPTSELSSTIANNPVNVGSVVNDQGEPKMALRFRNDTQPGICWNGTVTTPPNGIGQIAFTQLAEHHEIAIRDDNTTFANTSEGAFWVDNKLGIQYDGTDLIEGSDTAPISRSDSPCAYLAPSWTNVTVSMHFKLYLMYKSDEAGSIWVTLKELTWYWTGNTLRPPPLPSDWAIPTGIDYSTPNPEGVDSICLPQWSAGDL
jgi:hypothetical protein